MNKTETYEQNKIAKMKPIDIKNIGKMDDLVVEVIVKTKDGTEYRNKSLKEAYRDIATTHN